MHRKMFVCAAMCAALLVVAACPAWADLAGLETKLINGSPVVYDNATGYYWRPDLNSFTNLTYTEQKDKISHESYAGLSGWHMADRNEMNTLLQYELEALVPNFHRTARTYYLGAPYEDRYDGRYDYSLSEGYHDVAWVDDGLGQYDERDRIATLQQAWPDTNSHSWIGAWAVTTSAVPLPSSLLLLSLGTLLVGGAGKLRRRMRRN